jgi:hypothetical protein
MPACTSSSFDPETVAILRAAVDRAWRNLPWDRRTAQIKTSVAEGIIRSAMQGERDPVRLDLIAIAAGGTEARDAAL